MEGRFKADFFQGNRERLIKLFTGTAPIVLTANALQQQATSEPFPFVQDSSFWYLTGVEDPEVVLVIDKGKSYLVLPERSDYLVTFMGEQVDAKLKNISGVDEVLDHKEGWRRLKSRLQRAKHVATLAPAPAYIDVYGMYTNPARARLVERLKNLNADLKLLDLRPHISQLRMVKQPLELEAVKDAVKITEKSLKQLQKRGFGQYKSTFDIETDLVSAFRNNDADGIAFESVISAGPDTCVMHCSPSRQPLPKQGPLLLDVGAKADHYCADISRTYFLNPPTKRQRQVYVAVQEVYEFARTKLKPGVYIRDYEGLVERFMGEKLRELGLIKTIEHETVRHYFPHATSHHLGIDVHDVGDYEKPLTAGMVLTIEPGIYIPEEVIGIRLEDDVLITKDGNRVLSTGLPLDLA